MLNKFFSLKHQGSALISALFITALVSIATTAMMIRLQQDIRETRLNISSDRLYLASQEVIFWAMGFLAQEPLPEDPRLFWFPKSQAQRYPGVVLSGKLIDLQGRFNLNQLKKTDSDEENQLHESAFYLLLNTVLSDSNASKNHQILSATKDWINEKIQEQNAQKHQAYYLKQNPPYSASHQEMRSISEFRLVEGVDEKVYTQMLPYITVLPQKTTINLNTAPAPVIMTLGPDITENEAESIVQSRGLSGFRSFTQLNDFLSKHKIQLNNITLESDYFLCVVTAKMEKLEISHYAILKRDKRHHKRVTYVLYDSLNEA